MSYSDFMNSCIQNGYFQYVVILDPDSNIYWSNNPNWAVDGKQVVGAWKSKAPALMVAGTKFSSIRNDPGESFVGKNLGGGGTVIMQKCPNGYSFLTWSPADCQFQPINIHAEVARMAGMFG